MLLRHDRDTRHDTGIYTREYDGTTYHNFDMNSGYHEDIFRGSMDDRGMTYYSGMTYTTRVQLGNEY